MGKQLHFVSITVSLVWIAVITLAISVAMTAILRRRGSGYGSIAERLRMVWLVAAITTVAVMTLQPGPDGFGAPLPSLPNPFAAVVLPDAIANVVLYLPLGFTATLLWTSKPRRVFMATGLALCVSLAIELAQWMVPISRSAQIHDVIFNTLGGFVGAVAAVLVLRATSTPE